VTWITSRPATTCPATGRADARCRSGGCVVAALGALARMLYRWSVSTRRRQSERRARRNRQAKAARARSNRSGTSPTRRHLAGSRSEPQRRATHTCRCSDGSPPVSYPNTPHQTIGQFASSEREHRDAAQRRRRGASRAGGPSPEPARTIRWIGRHFGDPATACWRQQDPGARPEGCWRTVIRRALGGSGVSDEPEDHWGQITGCDMGRRPGSGETGAAAVHGWPQKGRG
jgi:hypothetical protein